MLSVGEVNVSSVPCSTDKTASWVRHHSDSYTWGPLTFAHGKVYGGHLFTDNTVYGGHLFIDNTVYGGQLFIDNTVYGGHLFVDNTNCRWQLLSQVLQQGSALMRLHIDQHTFC